MTAAALFEQMQRLDLTEPQVMHYLSEAGLISDHCVRLWDIAEPDLSTAVQWLKARRVRPLLSKQPRHNTEALH